MRKFAALLPLAALLLTESADALRCPTGYVQAAVVEKGVSVTRCVRGGLSAVESGKKKKGGKKKGKQKGGADSKSKKKGKKKGGSADEPGKTKTQLQSVVDKGVRIYQTEDQAQRQGATNVFELAVPAGGTVSGLGTIVITRCNECDVSDRGNCHKPKENPYMGSCYEQCGDGTGARPEDNTCYSENEFQPILQARVVLGDCEGRWSKPQSCNKENHHCTVVAPLATCNGGQVGAGNSKGFLQVAANSGGAAVKSRYVMQIKDSKSHGFFSVYTGRPSADSPPPVYLDRPLDKIHANYDDNNGFKPEWNNVLSVKVPSGNQGRLVTVQGSFKLELDPWDKFHREMRDTCSPLVLARVLFNRNKQDYDVRQRDEAVEDSADMFSAKVSQNCEYPNWNTYPEPRVCRYSFADSGILDSSTNGGGYVSVALNLHKSCIMEPNQKNHPETVSKRAKKAGKWGNYKADGDYYRVLDASLELNFIEE